MKKFILIVSAVMFTIVSVSAKQKSSNSFDWKSMYRSEVSVGFAIAGSNPRTVIGVPGGGDEYGPGVGSLEMYTRAADNSDRVHSNFSRPFIETIHGLQLNDYLFAGLGAGLQWYCGKLHDFQGYADTAAQIKGKSKAAQRWNSLMMPIFVDVRGMYPIDDELIPFVNVGLGATASFGASVNYTHSEYDVYSKLRHRGGLYFDFGAGIRWKQLSFSLGLQHQTIKLISTTGTEANDYYLAVENKTMLQVKTNAFYLKAGWNF